MKSITPFLWFNDNAMGAADFYTSIFNNSKIGRISYYGDAGPGPKGSVMVVNFWINGQEFSAINGGPAFKLNEAISFVVNCETQEEVDDYWEKLSDGGQKNVCGWLKDKYGLSWQITPAVLGELLSNKDKEKTNRVMAAMMKMTKIEINELKKAFEG
jgi:predicted 3-demethylubiquinone-9 3-methyltransferase (glyoxalase superfamily)